MMLVGGLPSDPMEATTQTPDSLTCSISQDRIVERAECFPSSEPPVRLLSRDANYDNPRYWSLARRIRVATIVCLMTLTLTFASSAYTASSDHIKQHLKASDEAVVAGVALYVFGFGIGPCLWGPAAQVFGHRPTYIVSFIAFTAFSFGVAESNSIVTLLVLRFLAAVSGSSGLSNGPATIGDIVLPHNAFRFMIFFALAAFAGPGIGPSIGAYIDTQAGWRWNMRVQAILIAIMLVTCVFLLPESNHVLLQQRANDSIIRTNGHVRGSKNKLIEVLHSYKAILSKPIVCLVTEPVVLALSLYLGLLYAVLYLSFIVVPIVFIDIRHFSNEQNGLTFMSLMVGFLTSAAFMVYCQERYAKKFQPPNRAPPEIRLRQTVYSSGLVPIGLLFFAWTGPIAVEKIHWVVPCIGLVIAFFGILTIFSACVPYLVEYAGPRAPIVMAGSTALRCTMAAAFPLFGRQMFTILTVQGGCSLMAGLALCMTPLTVLLYVFGARLRWSSTSQ